MSVAVLLSTGDGFQVSASASAGGVPPDGLGGPAISSLSGSATEGGALLLLEMEVGLATHSGDSVRVGVLLTHCGGSS